MNLVDPDLPCFEHLTYHAWTLQHNMKLLEHDLPQQNMKLVDHDLPCLNTSTQHEVGWPWPTTTKHEVGWPWPTMWSWLTMTYHAIQHNMKLVDHDLPCLNTSTKLIEFLSWCAAYSMSWTCVVVPSSYNGGWLIFYHLDVLPIQWAQLVWWFLLDCGKCGSGVLEVCVLCKFDILMLSNC